MDNNKPENPRAFPASAGTTQGMTLRDYFAAKAMNGLIAAWGKHDVTDYEEIASGAYLMADAMLKHRENN